MMHSQLPPNLEDFDQFWQKYREGSLAPVQVIHDRAPENGKNPDYDLVICGGTLGIFLGCAMQCKGWRVAIVEKNILAGREQEWNISRSELNALIEVAVLTEIELAKTIVTDYNPARIGFYGGQEVWVRDILNIGVSPKLLIEQIKYNFLKAGGMVLEQAKFHAATVYQNGVEVTIQPKSSEIVTLTGKVLIDAMGHFSPIVQQCYQNQADSICMVVGGCATGLPATSYGDLIYSFTPALRDKNNFLRQYFWEAFPAGDGRTVYSFVYLDRHNWQLSFDELWHTFYSLLPQYQSTDCNEISFKRQLMGFFPAYRNAPLLPQYDRLLPIGDSSGMQSPLSFGGFGSLLRHLPRLVQGLHLALKDNYLSQSDLQLLLPYQPNLSVTWLFQQVMSNPTHPDQINRLLNCTFQVMSKLGTPVITPFLKDTVQFIPLSLTMLNMAVADPLLITNTIKTVGIPSLLDWLRHFLSLGYYHFSGELTPPNPTEFHQFARHQALRYGSGRENYSHS